MIKNLLVRAWKGHLQTLAGWLSFCVFIALYNIALYSYFANNPDYSLYLNNLPPLFSFFVGHPAPTDPARFLAITTLSFSVPLIWTLLSIRIALRETAGEEELGTLDYFLQQPITRWMLYLLKAIGLLCTLFIMAFVLWSSLVITILITKMAIPLDSLTLVIFASMLFVWWAGELTLLIGALLGRVDMSALTVSGVLLVIWLWDGLIRVNWLGQSGRWFNPFGMTIMSALEKNTITPLSGGVMVFLIMITILGGAIAWQLRSFYNEEVP